MISNFDLTKFHEILHTFLLEIAEWIRSLRK